MSEIKKNSFLEKIKIKVYNLIRDDDTNDLLSNIIDWFLIVVIILNIFSVFVNLSRLSSNQYVIYKSFEGISGIVFTVEYILRVWTSTLKTPNLKPSKSRIRYIFSFVAVIDFVALIQFYIPLILPSQLRVLRAFRILRIIPLFKFNRYTDALKIIYCVIKRKLNEFISSIFIILVVILVSAVITYGFESAAQPEKFKNVFDGVWWAVTTVASVGYGDVFPITVGGKISAGITLLCGVISLSIPTAIISTGFLEISLELKKLKKSNKKCPHCGENI